MARAQLDSGQIAKAVTTLESLIRDDDAYADEMLSALARRLGFADRFERVVDALMG